MVLREGLSSGNTARFAFFQSIYPVESRLAQNALSESSLLNLGIFFFMCCIRLPFLPAHVSCGNHPDKLPPDGKHDKEHPARVRIPEGIETVFLFRVSNIVRNNLGAVEEELLAFRGGYAAPLPVLSGIVPVPVKTNAP